MWFLAHGELEVPATAEWLSRREVEHVDTIRFTKRRREFLTRRWTAKRAIATVLDLPDGSRGFARIEIRNRDSGAPYVEIDGRPAPVDVSLSDRAGWAVCLVGPPGSAAPGTLGIDLELVEPRSEPFIDDFFTVDERAFVRRRPAGAHRDEAANLIWSAKEAALKVQQVGLRADTRSVEVVLDPVTRPDGWSAMTVTGQEGPMPGWWRRDGVFLLTVACASATEPPQWLPGGSDLTAAVPLHSWVERPEW